MSNARRSRSRQSSSSSSSRITEDQMADLVYKLHRIIPEIQNSRSNKVSSSKVLQETCNYIRTLHQEIDDLSDRLWRFQNIYVGCTENKNFTQSEQKF